MGGSTSGCLVRFQSRCWLGLQCSEGLTRAGGSIPRWLPHMAGKLGWLSVGSLHSSPCGTLHGVA